MNFEEPINFLYDEKAERRRRLKKIVLAGALVVFLFLMIKFVVGLFPNRLPENPLAYDPVTLEPKKPEGFFAQMTHFVFNSDTGLQGMKSDRINILLLGIGGEGHDGPYLTDTMIIASIKPSTREMAFVSIPRDLLVDIPGHDQNKINAANAFGEAQNQGSGGALAAKTIKNTFGIDIPYYVRVDFHAFQDIIDTVGGITVNVERSFNDPMYPTENFGYKTVSFAKGLQTMDGVTALEYARSRHGSNGESSDFARSKRQQKMLSALKEKVLSAGTLANPIRMKSIMDSLNSHIQTNLNFGEILAFVRLARDLNLDTIKTLVFDTGESGYLLPETTAEGSFVLVPKTGNFDDMSKAIDKVFESGLRTTLDNGQADNRLLTIVHSQTQSNTVQPTRIEIQNGTWRAGLASQVKKQLSEIGYNIASIGNTDNRPQAHSGIYALTNDVKPAILNSLKDELKIPIKKDLPSNIKAQTSTDVFILLGEDVGN